jgi:NAD(P)H-nitrite reductase large subunit
MSDGQDQDEQQPAEADAEREPLHPAIRALKTICRCNNIKYRTIERAIREGAHTLNQVASRTTATTGECGGSCTPEVQALIAELAPKYAQAAAATAKPQPAANGDAWWVRKK